MGSTPRSCIDCWFRLIFRGFGQVMFQDHTGTGLLFFAGVAAAAPVMAVGGLIGAIIGPVVAYLMKYDRGQIEAGIYGFNPVLVGIGMMFYLNPADPLEWVLLFVGCVLSTFVTYWMRTYLRFPTYTSPFIVCTWLMLIIGHAIEGHAIDHKPGVGDSLFGTDSIFSPHSFVERVLAGNAEVMFGANTLTGLLFVVGIALCSWRHAVLCYLGSLIGTLIAVYHSDPEGTVAIGIYGYNACLAAISVYLWRKSLLNPIFAAAISVPLTEFFPTALGIPALTAPFVVASWIVIAIGSCEAYFCTD